MSRILRSAALLVGLAAIIPADLAAQQRITRRESRGEVSNRVTVSTVVAAVDNTSRVVTRLNTIGALTAERIRLIDVRPFIPAARRSTYLAALDRNSRQIENLRAELVTMDPVVRVLRNRRPTLTVDDVVGAGILDVIETGKSVNVLVLYVDSRNKLPVQRTVAAFRPNSGTLFTALYTTPEMVARVSALEALRLDRVRFYDIDAILTTADQEPYRAAVRANESSIRSLRAELSKRPVVTEALARHDPKLMLGEIFAADIIGSGDVLVVYYKRRAQADAG